MPLESLFDLELGYEGGFFVVAPSGGGEGAGCGDGSGRVSGERVSGSVRWLRLRYYACIPEDV